MDIERNRLSPLFLVVMACTVVLGVTGCGVFSFDFLRRGDTTPPMINSVSHVPDPASVDEEVTIVVDAADAESEVTLQFRTSGDAEFTAEAAFACPCAGEVTVSVKAASDGGETIQDYSFEVCGEDGTSDDEEEEDDPPVVDDLAIVALSLDDVDPSAAPAGFAARQTVALVAELNREVTPSGCLLRREIWNDSAYDVEEEFTEIVVGAVGGVLSADLILPGVRGRYRFAFRTTCGDEQATECFVLYAHDVTALPEGETDHRHDGSREIALDWGDLDLVAGAGLWRVRASAGGSEVALFDSGTGGSVDLDFLGEIWVTVDLDDGTGTFVPSVPLPTGSIGVNTEPRHVMMGALHPAYTLNVMDGAAISQTFSATDPNLDPVSFSMAPGFGWLSLDPATGALTGTAPSSPDPEDYVVVISATDDHGAESADPFTLTIYVK